MAESIQCLNPPSPEPGPNEVAYDHVASRLVKTAGGHILPPENDIASICQILL